MPGRCRTGLLPAAAAWLCACSGLQVGPHKHGVVVEAAGSAAGGEDAREFSLMAAERNAIDATLGLFISSATRAASAKPIAQGILSAPRAYVRRYRVLPPAQGEPASGNRVRALVLVSLDKLRRDLDTLGLVRPEGVYGTPLVLVSLKEAGLGAGKDVGLASDALRRALSVRGYQVQDFSDVLNRRHQETGAPGEAMAAAKAAGAAVVVCGSALSEPAPDERLSGYQSFRARVSGTAAAVPSGRPLAEISAEATAVDLAARSAAAKALENAGGLAGERLAHDFQGRFQERSELELLALGLSGLEPVRRFIGELRGLPGVAGAALAALGRREARVRVFVERLSADELAALVLRLPGYSFEVRSVEPDYRYVEVEAGAARQGAPASEGGRSPLPEGASRGGGR